jgi:hypothetical protein
MPRVATPDPALPDEPLRRCPCPSTGQDDCDGAREYEGAAVELLPLDFAEVNADGELVDMTFHHPLG